MRPTFKKLEVKDIGSFERQVPENVEGIEPGLKIVDSRLLLGQAAIDLVGLDAKGSLTLIALDFSADEGLLLRVMDAYSWCLEYPDTLRRLYPMAQLSTSRPPRILFIVERLTDSFLRRIKQLSFLEIDCLEFRHLEVNGASVVYFDHVERLRKPVVDSSVETPAPISIAPAVVAAVEPHFEPVKRPVTEPPVTRAVVAEPTRFEAPVPRAPRAQPPFAAPAAAVMPTPPAVPEYQSVTLATESPVTVSPSLVAAVAPPARADPRGAGAEPARGGDAPAAAGGQPALLPRQSHEGHRAGRGSSRHSGGAGGAARGDRAAECRHDGCRSRRPPGARVAELPERRSVPPMARVPQPARGDQVEGCR